MEELLNLLKSKNKTIASVESLTAGLFTSQLAEVSGASAVLKGGLVTYMTEIKTDVLHVEKAIVEQYGVVSKECAISMASHGLTMFHSDICVSFTGNAGPSVMEDKPAGFVCMAIAYNDKVYGYEKQFYGKRNEIRQQSVNFIVNELKNLGI